MRTFLLSQTAVYLALFVMGCWFILLAYLIRAEWQDMKSVLQDPGPRLTNDQVQDREQARRIHGAIHQIQRREYERDQHAPHLHLMTKRKP